MKTEKEIRKEIQDLLFQATQLNPSVKKDKQEIREIKSRLGFLKPILLYLETHPTEEFCRSELEKSEKRLAEASSRYIPIENATYKADAAKKKAFETELSVPAIKNHIKNLKFILNK